MIRLPPALLKSVRPGPVRFGVPGPLQLGMGGCPWRIAVASQLLCRTQRAQAEPVLQELLTRWPDAASLARAEGLESVVEPCGLHRRRARQLTRFSVGWLGNWWQDLRELPGVGPYVADAVGLFCFGCTDLECTDGVLKGFANEPSAEIDWARARMEVCSGGLP